MGAGMSSILVCPEDSRDAQEEVGSRKACWLQLHLGGHSYPRGDLQG